MSNQRHTKLPHGCLIAVGVLATLCGGIFTITTLASIFTPAAAPVEHNDGIATYVIQTALAISQQTQAASSPTLEPTFTSLPTAAEVLPPPPTATEALIPVTGASCIPDNPPQTGKVVDVVDGDTIKVLLDADGMTYSVRYIGMDTPEDTSQVEYFGPEATAKNSQLVYGKNVTIIKDVSETDRYDRLLRYVIADNLFVNYELVAQGYANTASYPPDVACIPTFQAAEQKASIFKLGLWGTPPTQAVILPLPTVPSSGSSSGSGGNVPCNCNGPDLDCKDFKTRAAAQACYDHCVALGYGNIFRLDGNDNDGLACESLP
jgi:micrococcal nuclease